MDLALEAGVSPRHLSFVETGRSRPSPELLLMLADRLEVPLRERNALLLAAGYAPQFPETGLDSDSMARVHASLRRLLDTHDPYPGVVVDRLWNVVLANDAVGLLLRGLPDGLLEPPINIFRLSLHPAGLASRTLNFSEWAGYLLGQLRRAALFTGDGRLRHLLDEVSQYPNVAATQTSRPPLGSDEPPLLVPIRLDLDGAQLSMFTTMTTFGTPQNVTLSELAVELFFPSDDASDRLIREFGARRVAPEAL
jgi:transcriptional regulator with XRE-family HTH domain